MQHQATRWTLFLLSPVGYVFVLSCGVNYSNKRMRPFYLVAFLCTNDRFIESVSALATSRDSWRKERWTSNMIHVERGSSIVFLNTKGLCHSGLTRYIFLLMHFHLLIQRTTVSCSNSVFYFRFVLTASVEGTLRCLARAVASADSPVLLQGPTRLASFLFMTHDPNPWLKKKKTKLCYLYVPRYCLQTCRRLPG